MTIHLMPVRGKQINAAWGNKFYQDGEYLFVRCRKTGKLGKPLNEKTAVYQAYEVLKAIDYYKSDYKIHWGFAFAKWLEPFHPPKTIKHKNKHT